MKKPDRYFAFLLRRLPASFRDRHGRELGALLDEMKEDLGPTPSKITLLRLYLAVTWDLLSQSPLSRPEPTPGAHEERQARGVGTKGTSLDGIGMDLKQAIRSLLHAPTYTIVALATLILGIGANAAIFSVVDAVLFRPPANVQDPEDLVAIYTSDFSGPEFGSSSYPDLVDFIAGAPALEAASGVRSGSANVVDDRGVTRILSTESVSGDYFDMLGATPFSGRWFTDEEGRWDSGASVAVLGHGTWSRMFGSDPAILGSQLRISGHSITIVGIAPPSLGSGGVIPALLPDLWLPPATEALMNGDSHFVTRRNRGRLIRGRLADGVTIETLQGQLDAVAAALHSEYPEAWTDVRGESRRVSVTPEGIPPEASGLVALFTALLVSAVVLLLLIACANVATITLVRGSGRHREIAVRSSLGASRGRVARHAVVESFLLGAVGGAGGLGLAWLLARVVSSTRITVFNDSVAFDLSVGPRVLAFSLAVTVLTMIAVGLLPALKAYRVDIAAILNSDGSTLGRGRRLSARNALVVAQVSVSLVLLVGGGLFIQSVRAAARWDVGFETEDVASVSLSLAPEGYGPEEAMRFFAELRSRIEARPDVERTALANRLPLGGSVQRRGVAVGGYTPAAGEDMEFDFYRVSAGFFETLGMAIEEGRAFDLRDVAGAPPVAIVNEAFAERFWRGQDPLGGTMRFGGTGGVDAVVVGIVADANYRTIGEEALPAFFASLDQRPSAEATLLARVGPGRAPALLAEIRNELRAIDPNVPIGSLRTMSDVVAGRLLPQRIGALLLVTAGGLGALLSMMGLYGVIAYLVSQRTREMGVRMALGASAEVVIRMVLGRGLALAAIGVVIGLAAAVGVTRFLESLLFGVAPTDPIVFSLAATGVIAASLLAMYMPARRAASVDPATTLREE